MGDGLLAEFASVVDAVECAIDIQRGMAERNSGEPEDQRVDLSRAALDRSRADDPYADRRLRFGIPRALRFVRTDSRSPPA
jgi:class 3 adenylate cyclase